MSRCPPQPSLRALFSGGQTRSPVSTAPLGECNAITNRWFGESDLTLRALAHPRNRVLATPAVTSPQSAGNIAFERIPNRPFLMSLGPAPYFRPDGP
jgi:hypothetical protein